MGNKNVYERFLWFDDRARAGKYPNASSLARKFEVSSKTAQRDIDFMRDRLGCPLLYNATEKGYYYENDTFSLPFMYLSSSEFTALAVARKLLQDFRGGISEEIAGAVQKITDVLMRHTAGIDNIDDLVSFHLVSYAPTSESTFRTVLEACVGSKTLTFTYSSPSRNEAVRRTVEPYHLLNYMGTWHLIAYCRLRNAIRDFKLSRISEVTLNTETFRIPGDFDFGGYFNSTFGLYKGGSRKQVTLRFAPEHARWVSDQVWHKDQMLTSALDGSLELSFPVADYSEIAREILKHGSGVEVIRPEGLRELVRKEAEKTAALYAKRGPH